MKKIMTLVIGVSLLFPSVALFAKERRGAQLVITKTDGKEKRGELIGVKQDSTLVLESSSGIGESVDLSEIKTIKMAIGSNTEAGGRLGLIVGGTIGAIAGCVIGYNELKPKNPIKPLGAVAGAAGGGFFGIIAGGLLGGAIGSSIPDYETFQIEGKSQDEIKAVLEILRTQARIPEYQ